MGARVVHVSSVHDATDPRIFHKECRTLAAAGYEVHLVAAGPLPEDKRGIAVHSFARPINGHRVVRFALRVARASSLALRLRGQIYHIHDPELLPLAVVLKATGARVIYDAHEDAPREARSLNPHRPIWGLILAAVASLLERIATLTLDGFVAATPTIARKYPEPRTQVVHNFPVLPDFGRNQQERIPYGQRENLILYAGSLFPARGLRQLVEAMGQLPDALKGCLLVAGRFNSVVFQEELQALAGWRRVRYVGWVPPEHVPELMFSAKLGVVVLHPRPEYLDSYPLKLFEYMAAGLPVVASSFPLWKQIVDDARCGVTVAPLDVRQIAGAFEWILTNSDEAEAMGRRGRAAVNVRFAWHAEAPKLLKLYASLAPDPGTPLGEARGRR